MGDAGHMSNENTRSGDVNDADGMSAPTSSMANLNLDQARAGEAGPSKPQTPTTPTTADALLDRSTDTATNSTSDAPSDGTLHDAAGDQSQGQDKQQPTPVAEVIEPQLSDGSTSRLNLDGDMQDPPPFPKKLETHEDTQAAIAAIKCRDFASNPPPQRPSPTATGYTLSTGKGGSGGENIRGLVSAPAVQTLATTPGASTTLPAMASGGRSISASSAVPPPSRPGPGPTGGAAPTASGLRRPGVGTPAGGLAARIPPSLQAKMAAMASRSNNPTSLNLPQNTHIGATERIATSSLLRNPASSSSSSTNPPSMPALASRATTPAGAPGRIGAMGPVAGRGPMAGGPGMGGLGKRRGPGAGLNLAQMAGGATEGGGANGAANGASANGGGINGRAGRPQMKLPPASATGAGGPGNPPQGQSGTPFSNFSKIVDPSGSLNFQNKAVLHAKGVDFSNGSSFNINMDELELQDELGAGNYGTVQKVFHKVTKVTMAMKEIRLELDDSKLKAIITELDILHRATAPEIVEFYGAFFIESCVYYCMEFMDAGSLEKLAGAHVPEPVMKRVTASMVRGLKFLKDELQTMHRDVKPTNVLVNTAGAIKLCDFGVSGQLERSLAKTNIGCQSYMAPERIKGESQNFLGSYTVSSDVWSLGLSIIEFAVGHYPYPPETYSNVFAQLQAIVHGDPPSLPDGYSKDADDFVARCLHKDARKRPTYAQLLQHPFLRDEPTMDIDMAGWVKEALAYKQNMKMRTASSSSTSSSTSV